MLRLVTRLSLYRLLLSNLTLVALTSSSLTMKSISLRLYSSRGRASRNNEMVQRVREIKRGIAKHCFQQAIFVQATFGGIQAGQLFKRFER